MHVHTDAGDWQSLVECVDESRLSRHQEQASSNTCSQFAHQHIQLQREHSLPQRPNYHFLLSVGHSGSLKRFSYAVPWKMCVFTSLKNDIKDVLWYQSTGQTFIETLSVKSGTHTLKMQTHTHRHSLKFSVSQHSKYVGNLLNYVPVENQGRR